MSEIEEDTGETTVRIKGDLDPRNSGERTHGMVMVIAGPQMGTIYILDQPDVMVGRGRGAHLFIEDDGLSRQHATIQYRDDGYYVRDEGSKNGTFLKGKRIIGRMKLEDRDRITLGAQTTLKFSLQDGLEQAASRQTIELATRDPLTGLLNRRHLDERLRGEFAYSQRHESSLHLLMFDLDHFKQVNDTRGHLAGDRVLRSVADKISEGLRVEDTVGRYGGEEFMIIARGIDHNGAVVLAERVRAGLESHTTLWNDEPLSVTTSVGVASRSSSHADIESLVSDADQALLQAKRDGRNRVVVAAGHA